MEPDGVHATFLIGRTKREAEWGVAKKVLEKLFERERQRVLSRGGGWAHGEGRGKGRRRGRCLLRFCCGRTRPRAASFDIDTIYEKDRKERFRLVTVKNHKIATKIQTY